MIDRHTFPGRPEQRTLAACAMAAAALALCGSSAAAGAPKYPDAPASARITAEGWFAPPQRGLALPTLPEKITNAVILPVRGAMTRARFDTLIKHALGGRDKGAQLVIVDLHNWTGFFSDAEGFARRIRNELKDVYVVCLARATALSADVVVALACDEVVVTEGARIGCCASTREDRPPGSSERVNFESRLSSELNTSAKRNGYNIALSEAMVSKDCEVWLVQQRTTGELRYVRRKTFADRIRRPEDPDAPWQRLRVVVTDKEVLTMTADQAIEFGFARRSVPVSEDKPYEGILAAFKVQGVQTHPGGYIQIAPAPAAAAPTTKPTTRAAQFPDAPAGAKITDEGWFAPPSPQRKPPALPEAVTNAFVIPIRGGIDGDTYEVLRRKILQAKAKGAQLILFDMDTWGGGVHAALDIARMIKSNLRKVYTVCYVRTRAVSAGALIAMACDEIIVDTHGKFGDCMPIVMIGRLEGDRREKMETVLREEFVESAENRGYPVALAECMVSIRREAWLVKHVRTRELRYVLKKDFADKVRRIPAKEPKTVEYTIESAGGGGGMPDIPGVTKTQQGTKSTIRIVTPAQDARENPDADWDLVRVVIPDGELPTFNPAKTIQYGFAKRQIPSVEGAAPWADVMKAFNVTQPATFLEDNWSEALSAFMTSGAITTILMLGLLIGVFIEFQTPGFGAGGILAIVCLGILVASRFVVGMAAWWEIGFIVVGIVLLGIEIFVTPGFGAFGITGLVLCLFGFLGIIVPNTPTQLPIPDSVATWELFRSGLVSMGLGMVGAVILGAIIARYLPKMPVAGRLMLAPSAVTPMATTADAPITHVAVGDVGTVHSACRPVGQVRFGETLVDAMADGEMIDMGEKVRVLQVEGNRIVIVRDPTA